MGKVNQRIAVVKPKQDAFSTTKNSARARAGSKDCNMLITKSLINSQQHYLSIATKIDTDGKIKVNKFDYHTGDKKSPTSGD